MNRELDDSLIGLSKDKMMKVSDFRTKVNIALMDADNDKSLELNEAVRYLHATKFDVSKAEELFKNYQSYKEQFCILSQSQVLSEIRTRKLEVLGTRDSKGAQLLLYTAARHTPKSHDSHNSVIQLFFFILDQISSSSENQLKGMALILDMRDCLSTAFNTDFSTSLFGLLLNGYPIYLNMIYIIEAPPWFKSHHKVSHYASLQQQGKIKHCTVSALSSLIPRSSLPQSLGGSFVTNMSSFVPSSEAMSHPLSPSHGTGGKNSVSTPPPRRIKPMTAKQQSSDTEDSQESVDLNSLKNTGSVNKIKEKLSSFEQHPVTGSHSNKPSPLPKPKLNGISNVLKGPKPLPPPRGASATAGEFQGGGGSGKTKVPIFPPPTSKPTHEESGSRKPFKKAKSFDEEQNNSVLFSMSMELPHKPAATAVTTPSTGSTTSTSGTNNASTKHESAKTDEDSKPKRNLFFKGGNKSASKDNDVKKASAQLQPKHYVRQDNNKQPLNPPPSYNPPSPPTTDNDDDNNPHSQSKPKSHATSEYANVNTAVKKNEEHTNKHPRALPYKVTTISSNGAPPVSSPTKTPTTSSAPKTTVKLRNAIPESVISTPSSSSTTPNTNNTSSTADKKKQNLYENVFFTKVVEDEGEILDEFTDDDIIYENFGPDEGNRWMKVDELSQYISKKGKSGLSSEYYKLKNDPLSGTSSKFKLACNTSKNRYKDVVCYDSTRVILKEIGGTEGSDYIHANYVNGFEKKNAFILTQGPLKRTVNDYWRMLWEKEVFVVVMTTKCVEMGKLKCAQYWPDDDKSMATFGKVSVSVVEQENRSSFDFRKLRVKCEGETRTLMHYQFVAWPDYGVPTTGKDVVELLYTARETQESFREHVSNPEKFPLYGPPLVIHCSAGIGRSGTFCALDYCIDELRVKGRVNIQHCVRQLRQQRAFAIQTDEQYQFCYNTVLEYGLYLKEAMKL